MEPSTLSSSTPQPSSTRPLFIGIALILVAIIISGGIIGSAIIKDRGAARDSEINRSLMITGHAEEEVTSDLMKWSITVSRNGSTSSSVEQVSAQVTKDVDNIISALAQAGVQNPTVSRHPMETRNQANGGYYGDYGTDYYSSQSPYAAQIVVIESNEVDKMNDATNGIIQKVSANGAYITTNNTEFFYTKKDELRRKLLEKAIEDAKSQAQTLGDSKVGSLLQVNGNSYLSLTPVNSSSYNSSYYGGSEDTSSIKKKGSIDVSVSYSIKK